MNPKEREEIKKQLDLLIHKHKIKEALLQFPEGMIKEIQWIYKYLQEKNVKVILHGDPTYGACDLPLWQAEMLGIKHIIHFAHAPFLTSPHADTYSKNPKEEVEVHYILVRRYISPTKLKKSIPLLARKLKNHHIKKVGLVSTIQYTHLLPLIKEHLKQEGIDSIIHKSKLQQEPGQILGCEVGAGKEIESIVDAIVYVGEGNFHPLGLIKEITKPLIIWRLDTSTIHFIKKEEKEKIIKRDMIRMSKLKEARKVMMLIPRKHGQYLRFGKVWEKIKEMLEKKGKEVYVMEAYHINPEILEGYEYDVIINLACPRIEDDHHYNKPIISLSTLMRYWNEIY